jgi:hypothetical protein
MGIFDRSAKRVERPLQPGVAEPGSFDDSPVENISLGEEAGSVTEVTLVDPSEASGEPPAGEPRGVEPPPVRLPLRPVYGISDVVELMRSLPLDQNAELVLQVVKTTLESLKVKVADLLEDAAAKQLRTTERIAQLKQEIVDREREVRERHDEIVRLEEEFAETARTQARLEQVERQGKPSGGKGS